MDHIPAVILAGGKASRMGGGDKPLMLWRGEPLLVHLIRELAPQVGPIAINANGDSARFSGFNYPVIGDSVPDMGPLSGILTAMEWAGAGPVMVIAGDTVAIPPDLVKRLAPAPAIASSMVEGEWRMHPTVGLWDTRQVAMLRDYLAAGQRRVLGWAAHCGAAEVRFTGEVLRNFNTPADLAQP